MIPTVKPSKIMFVLNAQKELYSISREDVYCLIHPAKPTIKIQENVLHAIMDMKLTLLELASKVKLKKEIPTAKPSTKIMFALNAQKVPSSTPSESASLLIPHAKLMMKALEDALPAILDLNLKTMVALKVKHLEETLIVRPSTMVFVQNVLKDLSSTLKESASLLILHAKLSMK